MPVKIKSRTHPFSDENGKVDNLVSVWNEDKLNLYIDAGIDFQNVDFQGDQIVWSTPHSVNPPPSANTVEADVWWVTEGLKYAEIRLFGKIMRVHVDVPWVGDISEEELSLLDPMAAGFVVVDANEAVAWAESLSGSLGYIKSNALQHAYWNALMASNSEVGAEKAILFSTGHEFTNRNSGTGHAMAVDSTMDMKNNFVGSLVVRKIHPYDFPDVMAIRTELLAKLNAGELWIIDFDDNFQVVKSDGKKILNTA